MKKIIATILRIVPVILLTIPSYGQHTHTHADGTVHTTHAHEESEETTEVLDEHLTSETSSAKYELLLRYPQIIPGEESELTLFISDYATNRPIENVQLQFTVQEDASIQLHAHPISKGTWHIHGIFPEQKTYSIAVQLHGDHGADLLLLSNVQVGNLTGADSEHHHEHWYNSPWAMMILSFSCGALLILIIQRITRKKHSKLAAVITILWLLIPSDPFTLQAHEGHDHGGNQTKKIFSNEIEVPKESQFLLDVFTQKVTAGTEEMVQNFFGTIIPSSDGQAIVSSPQTGRIVSLKTVVGSRVTAGQTLAIVEGVIDATAAMNMQAEKNNLEAEYEAARKELNRLNSVSDITAKKDLDEAQARVAKAQHNLMLFENKSAARFELKSPISGMIDNFTLSIGSIVNQGETLFTIINPTKVFVDGQVYGDAMGIVQSAKQFIISDANGNFANAQLLAVPQVLHESNQSQHVLFELNNSDNTFKIGEYVTIRAVIPTSADAIVIPASAITEVEGRACVFIKNAAEHYELRFVNTKNDNGTTINITKGIETDERVVTHATYQLKMIYLNQ